MTTAVDSSVLWMIFNDEPDADRWSEALLNASREGELILCDIVFAEIAPAFDSSDQGLQIIEELGIRFDPISASAAFAAGQIFKKYRQQGGPRTQIIPDFLIAAHALHHSDRFAAVDRGYLRHYFPKLKLVRLTN